GKGVWGGVFGPRAPSYLATIGRWCSAATTTRVAIPTGSGGTGSKSDSDSRPRGSPEGSRRRGALGACTDEIVRWRGGMQLAVSSRTQGETGAFATGGSDGDVRGVRERLLLRALRPRRRSHRGRRQHCARYTARTLMAVFR